MKQDAAPSETQSLSAAVSAYKAVVNAENEVRRRENRLARLLMNLPQGMYHAYMEETLAWEEKREKWLMSRLEKYPD